MAHLAPSGRFTTRGGALLQPSSANGHRGAKRQPIGSAVMSGSTPSMVASRSARASRRTWRVPLVAGRPGRRSPRRRSRQRWYGWTWLGVYSFPCPFLGKRSDRDRDSAACAFEKNLPHWKLLRVVNGFDDRGVVGCASKRSVWVMSRPWCGHDERGPTPAGAHAAASSHCPVVARARRRPSRARKECRPTRWRA